MEPPTWAIVAGGGTAGHLLPGLASARALVERGHPARTIHFVGSDRGIEARLVAGAGFTLDQLPGRGLQRRVTPANLSAVLGLVRATARGSAIVWRRRPAVVVCLGGHASFACGVGAVLHRVPLVLLEQNQRAGAVNRVLGPFAAAAAVSFEGTDLPRAVVTGNPLRPEVRAVADAPDRAAVRAAARAALGVAPDRTLVAVFTGSLGSRRINHAVRGLVDLWADRGDLAIRHVIGRRDHADFVARAPHPPPGGLQYQMVEYEDRMGQLLAAADLAVTRAGGSVAELAAVGLPAVLVPLPIAPRAHQAANAAVYERTGEAVVVADRELTTERLATELDRWLTNPDRLEAASRAMRALARPDAAEQVAALIEATARGARGRSPL